jgi:hypothetical protein
MSAPIRSRAALALPLVLVAAGCGDAPGANAPEASADHLSVHTDRGGFVSALVTAREVSGQDVSFGRYTEDDGRFVRGTAFGRPVYLTVEPDRTVGTFGTQPFQLHVEPAAAGLHFTGTVAGKPSDFWFGPREIRGTVGACGYELSFVAGAYQGSSGCASSPRMTSVEVPVSLSKWSPPELGAALAIFLSSQHG